MAWAPPYATTADLKAYVRVADSTDDAQIAVALEAASRAIDMHTGRQFGQAAEPEARYYTVRVGDGSRLAVDIDDLMTSVGLTIDLDSADDGTYATSVSTAAIKLLPLNAAPKGRPWQWLYLPRSISSAPGSDGAVRISAQWGWNAVPDTVKQAALIQASRLLKRRESPLGIAGSPDMGNELRLLAKVDPDVAVMLEPYCRMDWNFA